MFLKKSTNGKSIYFPYGKFFGRYELNSPGDVKKIRNIIEANSTLLISSLVTGYYIGKWRGVLFAIIVCFLFYPVWVFIITRKLHKTKVHWEETTGDVKPKNPVTRKSLVQSCIGLFGFIGVCTWFDLTPFIEPATT